MLKINQLRKISSLNPLVSKSISFDVKGIFKPPNIKFTELDESIEYLDHTRSTGLAPETIRETFSAINLRKDFAYFDQLIRDTVEYFATDMNLGYAWGIIAATVLMRTALMPISYVVQKHMQKMKLLEPELRNYRETMMHAYQTGNRIGGLKIKTAMNAFMQKYQMSNVIPLLNLLTIPVFISYFISLRYMVFTPELFPGISNSHFLWFNDLSQPDPYYILPFISAIFNFGSIMITRKLNPVNASTPSFVKKFNKYLPYTPFLGAVFLATFPAGLNLYWMTLSFSNMTFMYLFTQDSILRLMGIPKYYPNTIKALEAEMKEGKSTKQAFVVEDNEDPKSLPNEKFVKVYTRKPIHNNKKNN